MSVHVTDSQTVRITDDPRSGIYALRVALADRIAERDEAAWHLRLVEANCVADFIGSMDGDWKALGPNDEARKVNTTILLAVEAYAVPHKALRAAERAVRLAEAEIEAYHDQRRREREYAAHRLAEALNPDIVHGNALDQQVAAMERVRARVRKENNE